MIIIKQCCPSIELEFSVASLHQQFLESYVAVHQYRTCWIGWAASCKFTNGLVKQPVHSHSEDMSEPAQAARANCCNQVKRR